MSTVQRFQYRTETGLAKRVSEFVSEFSIPPYAKAIALPFLGEISHKVRIWNSLVSILYGGSYSGLEGIKLNIIKRNRELLEGLKVCLKNTYDSGDYILSGRIQKAISILEVSGPVNGKRPIETFQEQLFQLGQEVGKRLTFGTSKIGAGRRFVGLRTDKILIQGVSLGPYEIRLYNHTGPRLQLPSIYCSKGPRYHPQTIHPQVENNDLCYGVGKTMAEMALYSGRVADLFDIVLRILNTDSDDCYIGIDEWNRPYCDDCCGLVKTLVACHICRRKACSGCLNKVGARFQCLDCQSGVKL